MASDTKNFFLGTLLPSFFMERKVFSSSIGCLIIPGKQRDNPQIGYAKPKSEVCTGQFMDSFNRNLVLTYMYIYTFTMLINVVR